MSRPESLPHPKLNPFVKRLFDEQRRKNIKMRELAQISGYSRKTLYDMKSGYHSPSIRTVIDVGMALGLNLQWVEIEEWKPPASSNSV